MVVRGSGFHARHGSVGVAAPLASVILMHLDGINGSTTFTDVYGVVAPTANGSAAISTTQSKFGGASITLPGATSWASGTPSSAKLNVGTGDFTIEFWVYMNASPAGFANAVGFQASNGNAFEVGINGTGVGLYVANISGSGVTYTGGSTVTTSAWHAIATVRKSGTIYIFIDGTSVTSSADTTNVGNLNGVGFFLGTMSNGTGGSGNTFNGYIDEIRVSNAGLYTTNYTPASSAFAA
jgi:hypothetical protein